MASKCSDSSTANLRSPSEIPLKYRHIFSQYETFNQVQSKVLDKVLYSNDPIVISAPTGSGKTAIFELAILRLLLKMEDLDYTDDFKIIYVAPVKALCMEKFTDWREKFEPVGVKCLEATGDSEVGDFSCLVSAKLVVTTPEKWDSLTRKWRDAESMMEAVKLFIIDEVHLVNEDVRGPTLEAVVSRMKTIRHIMKTKGEDEDFGLRFIAASATIPNIEDVAAWLGEDQPACFYRISESLRPVKLQKHVIGFNSSAQGFRFDMNLNYKLAAIVRRYSNDKPTLIFCSSRKSVEMASKVLADESSLVSLGDSRKFELQQVSRSIQDSKLKQLVMKGIAYHHAGLSYQDRAIIEDAFRKSVIVVLVCTNTLAMGVNFPAHLVIIKSTESYVCGKSQEYTESAILQMIGRAGRPQYDLTGVAVIMTQQKNVRLMDRNKMMLA
ncbi:unnamed protein product [Hermetia illucens]|uniref:Uncharacterized protein n=1 Tax=Hermetia illucens TaxID=343691 RepID=A0A7R8V0A5_HERIL|nr:unnamed protein product [Hermetia illucens]